MHILGNEGSALELWQWDTGRVLVLDNPANTVDFVYNGKLLSIEADTQCAIPDLVLQTAGTLMGYINAVDADGRFTRERFRIAVRNRPKPQDYVYTPREFLDVRGYVEQALQQAKDSGDFDGKDYVITNADYNAIGDVVEGRFTPRFDALTSEVNAVVGVADTAIQNTRDATAAAVTATKNANTAKTNADTATANANSAASQARTSAGEADTATARANAARERAQSAGDTALASASAADTAKTAADTAANLANQAANLANQKAQLADTAAANADTAVSAAIARGDTAVSDAVNRANAASIDAETAVANANQAVTDANNAIQTANQAAQNVSGDIVRLDAEIEKLLSGTKENARYHLGFYLDENGELCEVE